VIPGQILSKQAKPTAWANHSFAELNDVYSHTFDVLTTESGRSNSEWVQVGNEIRRNVMA
jgi:arabinogalactan endo-1,4-beta-galactosidase